MKLSLGRFSISFVILALILGMFVGAAAGSLAYQVFGLEFLNRTLMSKPWRIAEDFYLIKVLEIQVSPAALIGLVLTGYLLYKRSKN